jgi:hypothetical protein
MRRQPEMKRMIVGAITSSALLLTSLLAGSATATAAGAQKKYSPDIRPSRFVDKVDNPYFPLTPGARWVYEALTPDGNERTVVEVTNDTKKIAGIDAVVVHDTVAVDGQVIEDTFDWYAQDRDGNVWYLGEDTKEYENGKVSSTKGSWETGVKGALPGIVMEAHPKVGDKYRQEYFPPEALDKAVVLGVKDDAAVPFGTVHDVVTTSDLNPLTPKAVEQKYYAPGVGLILEVMVSGGVEVVQLVEYTAP